MSTSNSHKDYISYTVKRPYYSSNSRVQSAADSVAAFDTAFARASNPSHNHNTTQNPSSHQQQSGYITGSRWESERFRDQSYHGIRTVSYDPRTSAGSARTYTTASSLSYYDSRDGRLGTVRR